MAKRNKLDHKANWGGARIPSKEKMYAKIAMHSDDLIDKLLELTDSRNIPVRLGALKVLINKVIPDLKAIEMKGDKDHPIVIRFMYERDYRLANKELSEATSDI